MAYLVGLVLATIVSVYAAVAGLDRDRAFYPTVLVVIALYYVLFGAIGESNHAVVVETLVMSCFMLIALVGFKSKLWWVVAGFAAHGVLDFFHGSLIVNPGVPAWWPAFCLAYDVTAAGILAWLLKRSPSMVEPRPVVGR